MQSLAQVLSHNADGCTLGLQVLHNALQKALCEGLLALNPAHLTRLSTTHGADLLHVARTLWHCLCIYACSSVCAEMLEQQMLQVSRLYLCPKWAARRAALLRPMTLPPVGM